MFGLSKKEKFEKEVTSLIGLSYGLSREIRALLVKRHPEMEVFIESQPRSIKAIHYTAAAITQFSWLMHSKGKLPMDELLDEFHLTVMKETMKERNYDTPPQIAHREYSTEYSERWRSYKDILHKILLDKRVDHIELFYMQIEEDALQESILDGAMSRVEASQELFSLVLHALAFLKKNL